MWSSGIQVPYFEALENPNNLKSWYIFKNWLNLMIGHTLAIESHVAVSRTCSMAIYITNICPYNQKNP